jgi:hypothetical protein
MVIDKFTLAADPRFQALSASDKRRVLSGEIDINQVVDLTDADTRYAQSQGVVPPPLPEPPRETTWGEFAQGVGAMAAEGILGASQTTAMTARAIDPLTPLRDYFSGTDTEKAKQGIAEFYKPAQDALRSMQPEAFQREMANPIIGRDEEGNFTGFNAPTAEQLVGTLAQSAAYIPQLIAGGGLGGSGAKAAGLSKGLGEFIGFGASNAASVAQNQYAETFNEVKDALLQQGRSEEEATRIAGDAASEAERNTAALAFTTGGLGGALASRLGGASASRLGGMAKGFIGDALFEAPEEAGQTAISQLSGARGQLDTREIEQAAALGAIAGGGPGAVIGFFSYDPAVREASAVAKELSKEVDNSLNETLKKDIEKAVPAEGAVDFPSVEEVANLPVVEETPRAQDMFSGELTPVRPDRVPVEETPLPTRTALSQELPLENTADFTVLEQSTPVQVQPPADAPAPTVPPTEQEVAVDEEGLASPEEVASITQSVEADNRIANVRQSLSTRGLPDVDVYYEPPKQGESGITQGRFNIDTGKLELNAAALEDDADVAAVAVHEINHALNQAKDQGVEISRRDLTSVIGSDRRPIVNKRIRALSQVYPEMKRAVERATKAGIDRKNPEIAEIELLSYALEEITKTRESGKNLGPRLKTFVRDMVAEVKGFLARVGTKNKALLDLSKSFNEADLYRLGKVMMKEYASGTRPRPEKTGGTLESFGMENQPAERLRAVYSDLTNRLMNREFSYDEYYKRITPILDALYKKENIPSGKIDPFYQGINQLPKGTVVEFQKGFDETIQRGKVVGYTYAKGSRISNPTFFHNILVTSGPPEKIGKTVTIASFNVRNVFTGPRVLESFGGVKAKKADIGNYARAEEMDVAGADSKVIWEQTGWRKAKDGKWRFEIDDSKATLKPAFKTTTEAPASEVFDNPDVFENYPQLKSIPIKRETLAPGKRGYFQVDSDGNNSITVNASLSDAEAKSTILHEMQHAIQVIEGFARGGTSDSVFNQMNDDTKKNVKRDLEVNLENNLRVAKEKLNKAREGGDEKKQSAYSKSVNDVAERIRALKSGDETALKEEMKKQGNLQNMYRSLLGEVEARNVQFRESMSPQERTKSFPEGTEDTSAEDQIVSGTGDTAASETTKKKVTKRYELTDKDRSRLKNLTVSFEAEVDGNPEVIEGNALRLIEQQQKRLDMLEKLKACVGA